MFYLSRYCLMKSAYCDDCLQVWASNSDKLPCLSRYFDSSLNGIRLAKVPIRVVTAKVLS